MQPAVPIVGFFLLGLALGAILQRTHFCTMGCVSDAVLFGSLRRLRIWALAVMVALVGTQALDVSGIVDVSRSVHRQHGWLWVGALPGGLLFGLGMVQAGGCVSRNLARLGAGSLKAGTALAVTMLVAVGTSLALPEPVPTMQPARSAGMVAPGLVAVVLLVFCVSSPGLRRSREDLATGFVLGALIPAGWLITSWAGARPDSLNFMALDRPGLIAAVAVGTMLGAFATARARHELRLERFTAPGDLRRHLVGGLLMGVGGALALGCTVGQGLTGVSTLSPGSYLALGGMLVGAWWGVKQLETGRLLPWLSGKRWRPQRQSDVADAAD